MKKFFLLLALSLVFECLPSYSTEYKGETYLPKTIKEDTLVNKINDSISSVMIIKPDGQYSMYLTKYGQVVHIKKPKTPAYIWFCVLGTLSIIILLVVLYRRLKR